MADLFTRSQCCCCQQEVTGLGIECAECNPSSIRLCVECFALGAEVGPHKADHRYRFFDSGSLGIFPNSNWSAREEIRLLDAIEQYGFGNWQDISKHIESKTPAESKDEYVSRFVLGTTGQITWSNLNKEKVQRPSDIAEPDEGPLSPSLTQKLTPLDIQPDEIAQLGYMPNRDDYEKEYDNEAEKLVSQLVFNTDDEDVDMALKLALVDMYAKRLRERCRRKRVIRDYQLVTGYFKKDIKTVPKKRFGAYEKELQDRFKTFAQFHSLREHEHFIRNLVAEKELKFRLEECYKYRRNGIIHAEECLDFERRSRKRTHHQSECENELSVIPEDGQNSEDSIQVQRNQTIATLTPKLLSSHRMSTITGERRNGNDPYLPSRKRIALRSSCDDSNLNSEVSQSEVLSSLATGLSQRTLRSAAGVDQNSQPPLKVVGLKATADQFTANIDSLPVAHLLSSSEKHLCLSTHLLPSQYLTIKAACLVQPNKWISGRPQHLSDTEWTEIVDFLASNGWVPPRASSASQAE